MKLVLAVAALSVFASSAAFAGDVCGIRAKAIPLLGSVEYSYSHKGNEMTMEITKLDGLGAKTMINKGLKEGVDEALKGNAAEAAKVNEFLAAANLQKGSVVKMKIVDGKTVITVGDKKSDGFSAQLLSGLSDVIEGKLKSGDGGSRVVPCK